MSTQIVENEATLTVDEKTKEMYYLSVVSNITGSYIVDKVSTLETRANQIKSMVKDGTLSTILKDKWKVVWGPCIKTSNHMGRYSKLYLTDNLIYAAQNKTTGDYFVGIAGTNPVSEDGWFNQDFKVEKTVSWSSNPEHGKISEGTSNGIQNLKSLVDKNKNILDFLKNAVANKTCEVAFAGHSLGGALSPTLAVALKDELQSTNSSAYAKVSVAAYPTAGPTPGDEKFATYMKKQLSTYVAVNNTLDAVPRAWILSDLEPIPSLYLNCTDLPLDQNRIIQNFIRWAMKKPHTTTYARPEETVITWNNGCTKGEKTQWIKDLKEGILNSILQESREDLEIINQKPLTKTDLDGFKFFLSTLASQHTIAYSGTDENGFQLNEEFLREYKQNTKLDLLQGHRAIKTGTKILNRLIKEVAIWVKKSGDYS